MSIGSNGQEKGRQAVRQTKYGSEQARRPARDGGKRQEKNKLQEDNVTGGWRT